MMTRPPDRPDRGSSLEAIELELLLEALYRRYGFDFREYAAKSLRRRIREVIALEQLTTISGLQERLLHDPAAMGRFLQGIFVHVTAMFRDPPFYLAFQRHALPLLRTYPSLRIWHAGCATGEEVYSMAIMLTEAGLYDRSTIYATDISDAALDRARDGSFPLELMQEFTRNYIRAGGTHSFSEYYSVCGHTAIFHPSLREKIVFTRHNLAIDAPFNEFNVIWCRNVMIYFNKHLQQRVHTMLYGSLARFGVLGLGEKESLQFTPYETRYEAMASDVKLYRKIS